MTTGKTYLDLCTQVYELSKPIAPEEEYAFYKSYASEAQGAMFEPMCGTGRFLLPLVKEGYKVEGSDASQHMLAVLKKKVHDMNVKPDVWQGVAYEIPDTKSYVLIFIPSGSFGLITNPGEFTATLKSFYDHLEDTGALVFEAETKCAVPELGVWGDSKWTRPDGKVILLSSYISMDNDIYSCVARYELIDNNQVIQTEIEEYKIKIYEPLVLLKVLKNIGFKDVKPIKAFSRANSPDNNDKSIVYECRK